jgi:transposase
MDTKREYDQSASFGVAKLLPFMARLPTCLVGMEACGGVHYWAHEIAKLRHEVKVMSPRFVHPYVNSSKTTREILGHMPTLLHNHRCDS